MFKRNFIVICLICLGCLASMFIYREIQVQTPAMHGQEDLPVADTEKVPKIQTITLTAAGDCLMHGSQIRSGLQPDGSYCFEHFFVDVKDLINEGDYSSTDFEAALAGPETGYTGYPTFNSPDATATTFKEAGFDLIVTANNHSLDRGYKGAIRTLDVLQGAGLDTVGTYRNKRKRSLFIKDIKGVKVGYLAYSYGTNGLPVPDEHPEFLTF